MGLENRPFIGTWSLNGKELVQHTPDALIYLNGDTALPGCTSCSGKIEIQQFITECSVDAGTEAGSSSASFTLSVPLHHTDSFARDAKYLLRPGLEVHIYMRGYFPVRGLYEHLAEGEVKTDIVAAGATLPAGVASSFSITGGGNATSFDDITPKNFREIADKLNLPDEFIKKWTSQGFDLEGGDHQKRTYFLMASAQVIEDYWRQKYPDARVIVTSHDRDRGSIGNHGTGAAIDFRVEYEGGKRVPALQTWGATKKLQEAGRLPKGGTGLYLNGSKNGVKGTDVSEQGKSSRGAGFGSGAGGSANPHYDWRGWLYKPGQKNQIWFKTDTTGNGSDDIQKTFQSRAYFRKLGFGDVANYTLRDNGTWKTDPQTPDVGDTVPNAKQVLGLEQVVEPPKETDGFQKEDEKKPNVPQYGPSALEKLGLDGQGIEKALAYPYYPVFHGVVTEVGHSYSGGVNTITVNCSSMLHFWQYQNMSTNASLFGARPTNSKNKMSLVGHNFTGMHPYEIMYTLHYDTAGAAGGVGWALGSKTNQTATSTIGGESLFSLTQRYWEERFKGRVTQLRLHGATGALFSTMSAAFLARTSSNQLLRAVRKRYNDPKDWGAAKKILQQSQMLGLFNKNHREAQNATSFAASSKGEGNAANKPKFEINILEMQAFVTNISNWGQVNLFESSYESKLDVAQKVCEVTGFEFYQDVDGDFVFKPPMYNLDTSSSRVYRIEDIDIINISSSEKEPQITYMTVKGSHFKNTHGTGLDGEWGVQGKYIDYRLVAKFGWRPGSYETAYFNDPKSMFFSAVNRMDIMNAGINSASVTIPVRPEIRPGYPVYIPYLDAYYYCNSFSHSHSVGGQCTTSLQLIAKRAKFYAPGVRTSDGNSNIPSTAGSNIRLGDTLLPELPLEVWDEAQQKPALSGFPNVVMALDPTAINPLFWVVGTDVENIADPKVLKSLLDQAVSLGILSDGRVAGTNDGGKVYFLQTQTQSPAPGKTPTPQRIAFYLNDVDFADTKTPKFTPENAQGEAATKTVNVLAAATEYQALVKAQLKKSKKAREKLQKKAAAISKATADLSDERAKDPNAKNKNLQPSQKKIDDLIDQLTKLEKERLQLAQDLKEKTISAEEKWKDTSTGKSVAFLLDMLEQTGQAYRQAENFQNRSDLNSTVNLLDMLSDKKAIFSNGTQPGRYRYYSCSHPEESEQGPKKISYDGKSTTRVVTLPPERVESQNRREVLQYAGQRAPFPGAREIGESFTVATPEVGIRVLNSNPESPGGEVLLTADVMELSFSVQDVQTVRAVTSSLPAAKDLAVGKDVRGKILQKLEAVGAIDDPTVTLEDHFEGVMRTGKDSFESIHQKGIVNVEVLAAQQVPSVTLPLQFETPGTDPQTIQLWSTRVDTTRPVSRFKYSGNEEGEISLGPAGSKATLATLTQQAALMYADKVADEFARVRASLNEELLLAGVEGPDRQDYLAAYNEGVKGGLGASLPTWKFRKAKGRRTQRKIFSPVFPISDDRGYEVVGSYRYGRGVDIDPEGVFAQLHQTDVFSLLSKDLVDNILKVFVRNGSIRVPEFTEEVRDGVKVTVPTNSGKDQVLGPDQAKRYLNQEALRQLRDRNLTDKQILDRQLAVMNEDTGLLEFGMSNYFADQTKSGVHKIPVINAAYSLADLNVQRSGHICDCKAAEASVLLTAFGQTDFVQFTPNDGTDTDKVTQWVQGSAAVATAQWEQQQQALRGEILDRPRRGVVKTFLDEGKALADAGISLTEVLSNTPASERQGTLSRRASAEFRELERRADEIQSRIDNNPLFADDPVPPAQEDD